MPTQKSHLLAFTKKFNGQHFIKEAYQKLAWYEMSMNNDVSLYKYYMAEVLKKGKALVDEDKQAEKEALAGEPPIPFLLKSRLFYDGGYSQRAMMYLERTKRRFYDIPNTPWSITIALAVFTRPAMRDPNRQSTV